MHAESTAGEPDRANTATRLAACLSQSIRS